MKPKKGKKKPKPPKGGTSQSSKNKKKTKKTKSRVARGTSKKKLRKLTPKQDSFCREYLVDHNGSKAAIRAGYSKKGSNSMGAQLLAKISIQTRIAELQKPAIEKAGVSGERVIQKLADIAFLDPLDLFNDDGSLKNLSEMPKAARCVITGIEVTEEFEGKGEDREFIGYTKKIKLKAKLVIKTKTITSSSNCTFTI